MQYDMKSLIETFGKHVEEAQRQKEKNIAKWKEFNPDEELPEHLTCDFYISLALKAMCEKIMELEKKIG